MNKSERDKVRSKILALFVACGKIDYALILITANGKKASVTGLHDIRRPDTKRRVMTLAQESSIIERCELAERWAQVKLKGGMQ
jgi:hypothetical protein